MIVAHVHAYTSPFFASCFRYGLCTDTIKHCVAFVFVLFCMLALGLFPILDNISSVACQIRVRDCCSHGEPCFFM